MLFGWWLPCIWSLNEALNKHLFRTRLSLETTWHIMRGQGDQVNFAGCRRCSLTFSISLFNSSFIISVLRFIGDIRRKKCRRALALHTPIKFRLSSTYCSSILQIGDISKSIRSILLNLCFSTTIICCLHSSTICLWQTVKSIDMTQEQPVIIECIPVVRTSRNSQFFCQGPRIWNCLPASVTNLSSFSIFKNKVLEFFFKNVPELV